MTYTIRVDFLEAQAQLVHMLGELGHGERKRVADEVEVSPGYITHIIKGRKSPNQELQSKLLRALGYRATIEYVKIGES
jgi:hypothetical protein